MVVLEAPASVRKVIELNLPSFGRAASAGSKGLYLGVYREADERWSIMYRTYVGSRSALDGAQTLAEPASELVGLLRAPPQWQADIQAYFENWADAYRNNGLVTLGKVGLRIDEHRPALRRKRLVAVTENYKPKNMLNDKSSMPGLGYATEIVVLAHLQGDITHVSTTTGPSIARVAQLDCVGLERERATRVGDWIAGLQAGLERSLMRA